MINRMRVRELAKQGKPPIARHLDFLASASADLNAAAPLLAEFEALAIEREGSDAPFIDYGSLHKDAFEFFDDPLIRVVLKILPFENAFLDAIEQVRIHQEIETMRRRVRGRTSEGRRAVGDRLLVVAADVWTFMMRLCSLKDRARIHYTINGRVIAIGSSLIYTSGLERGHRRVSVDSAKDSLQKSGDPTP
jgi:hypothetical protein